MLDVTTAGGLLAPQIGPDDQHSREITEQNGSPPERDRAHHGRSSRHPHRRPMTERHQDPQARTVLKGVQRALVTPPRPNPVVVLWRWRHEIALLGTGTVLLPRLVATIGPVWAIGATLGVSAAAFAAPTSRKTIIMWAKTVVPWVHSNPGRLPAELRTAPRSNGERVAVWCPVGVGADDLAAASEILAASCWAPRAHVEQNPRHAHIVVLCAIRTTSMSANSVDPDPISASADPVDTDPMLLTVTRSASSL
jgi:hypothetical protein